MSNKGSNKSLLNENISLKRPLSSEGKSRSYGTTETNHSSISINRENANGDKSQNNKKNTNYSNENDSFDKSNKNNKENLYFESKFEQIDDIYGENQNNLSHFFANESSQYQIINLLRRGLYFLRHGTTNMEYAYEINSSDKGSSFGKEKSTKVDFSKSKDPTTLQLILGKIFFSIFYLINSVKSTLRIYLVSLISLIISIIIIAVLYQTIQKSNIIFLYVAEGNSGEMDFIWQRKLTNESVTVFMNHSLIEEELLAKSSFIGDKEIKVGDYVEGISPRWLLPGYISNPTDSNLNSSAIFLIMDTEKEKKIGVGRNWGHRPLGIQEAHVRDILLKAADAKPNYGEEVFLSLNIQGLVGILNGDSLNSGDDTSDDYKPVEEDTKTDAQALHELLERLGFNFNQVFVINVTRIVEEQRIPIPEPLKPIIDQFGILNVTGEQIFQFIANGTNTTAIGTNFRVVDSVEGSDGLFPSSIGNVVIVDSKFMGEVIRRTLVSSPTIQFLLIGANLSETVNQFLSSFNLSDFSLMIVGMLKRRFEIYEKSSSDRARDIIKISDDIMSILGIDYPVSFTYPLVQVMELSNFLNLFLNQIFNTVLVILGILACILLNMLLMSNIDDHVYEYGMIRALGLDKYSLVGIIFSYAFMFAIPGVIIGLILAYGVNIIVNLILSKIINLPYIDWKFSAWAIILSIVVGLGVTTLANVIPARRALSRTLRDALDLTFQTFNQTTVTMIRLEKMGLQLWQTVLAILLVVSGFIVYYMIPYAFTFQNFDLFFMILNGILLFMMIGLCLIAVVLEPFLEKLILFIILIGPERRLRNFIQKNMSGHRNRSRQTFIMFTIATAFVIFAGVSFSLQTSAIVQNAESIIGGDIVALAPNSAYPLPETELTSLMEELKSKQLIEEYSYISYRFRTNPMISNERISALAAYPLGRVQVNSLSDNYLRTTMTNYFLSSDIDSEFDYKKLSDGKPDIVRSLYEDAGKAHVSGEIEGFYPSLVSTGRLLNYIGVNVTYNSTRSYEDYIDAIASTATKETHSIGIDLPARLTLTLRSGRNEIPMPWLVKPKAFVYKFPGFVFSAYSITSTNSPFLISENDYKKILTSAAKKLGYTPEQMTKLTQIPKNRLLMKHKKPITDDEKSIILNGLRSKLNSERTLVQSVEDIVNSTATAKTILNWSFNALALIACLLCFLNLTTAFTANVKENQWIYGVLRALGMTGFQLTRSYIYEAICLVLASFGCGSIIGTTLAITLVLQQNLFLQNPLVFDFPWILFFFLLFMATIVAILGSWIPSRNLQKKEIAYILKGM